MAGIVDTVSEAGARALTKMGTGLVELMKEQADPRSLADIGKGLRVEPLVLLENTLRDQPYIENVLKLGLSTFIGYYLNAVNVKLSITDIRVLKTLDQLNPDRGQTGVANLVELFSEENYGLPSAEEKVPYIPNLIGTVSNEAGNEYEKLFEVDRLCVGKIVEITIPGTERTVKIIDETKSTLVDENEKKARESGTKRETIEKTVTTKLPIMVRLITTPVKSSVLTQVMASGIGTTFADRLRLAKAGQLRYIADLVFGMDMLDQHRKAMMEDDSGIYNAIIQRRRGNAVKTIVSGKVSLATASNIAIITDDTAKEIVKKTLGDIKDPSVREKVFNSTYLLLLIVVNDRWEKITVYHRGLSLASEYTFKELEKFKSSDSKSQMELFKMFQSSLGNLG